MKYLFCVLLALSLAACGKETEDPGLSREEFLDLFPLHEHGEVYLILVQDVHTTWMQLFTVLVLPTLVV